jgi:hypothetical protein
MTRSSEKKLAEITVTFQPMALINPVINKAPIMLIDIGIITHLIFRNRIERINVIVKTTARLNTIRSLLMKLITSFLIIGTPPKKRFA